MSLLAAATLGDDIVHTPLLAQILKVATTVGTGLLTGIAIGAAAAFIVGTGGLGAVVVGAVVGAVIGVAADKAAQAAGAKSLDDAITAPLFAAIDKFLPGVVKGTIVTGSSNVFINGFMAARAAGKPDPGFPARQAARAAAPPPSLFGSIAEAFVSAVGGLFGLAPPEQDFGFIPTDDDKIACQDHPPMPPQFMAEGSASVFINAQPAVRVGDKSTCDGKVSINPGHAAKRNVSIGGESIQVRAISSEMPPWLDKISRYAGLAIGLCQAIRGKGPLLNKLVCFGTNMALSMAADAAVRGTDKYLSGQLGHPVHLPSGAKILNGEDDEDFTLAAHLPLTWMRCYNSGNAREGLFGRGWMVLYDVELQLHQPDPQDAQAQHVFVDLQGRRMPLPALELGEKYFAAQEGLTFARTEGGHYMVSFNDGFVIDFGHMDDAAQADDAYGRPVTLRPWALEDRNGNAHYLRYDDQARLTGIATDCGQYVALDYDASHPRRVGAIHQELHWQRRTLVRFAYDARGDLAEVLSVDGAPMRRFAYDEARRMTLQRFPQGLEVRYRWQVLEAAEGKSEARVVGYATNAGEQIEISYALEADGAGRAQSVDQLGRTRTWTWDARKRVTFYTDPLGGRFALRWAEEGRDLLAITNPAGGTSHFSYDPRGNITQEIDPLGQESRTGWHSIFDEPTAYTTPDGACWAWEYDATCNLVQETAPGGLIQSWSYDRHGAVVAHVDARGGLQRYRYDGQGRLLQATDCSERSTRYEYDAWGQAVRQIDAAGHVTAYQYDEQGRLQCAILPDGMTQSWRWRRDGLPESQERAGALTCYEWDAAGRLATVTDPVGNTTRRTYDSAGRMSALVDGRGAVTRFDFDADDRLVAQTGIDGLRTEYRYDACGRPIALIQGAGTPAAIRIELVRDALGRLTGKLTPETHTRYHYDQAGRLVRLERRLREGDAPASTVGDSANSTSALSTSAFSTWPLIDEIAFAYDASGNTVSETTTTYRLQTTQESGQPAVWTPLETPHRTELTRAFDALGNPLRTTLPDGPDIGYLYYGSGHLHQLRFADHVISDIERDALHREVSRTQGALLSEYTLDPMGRLLQRQAQPQEGHWTPGAPRTRVHVRGSATPLVKRHEYTAAGDLLRTLDAHTGERHFVHDAAGRVLEHSDGSRATAAARGLLSSQPERFEGETFAWDQADNALPITKGGSAGRVEHNRVLMWQDIRYRYDEHGRIVAKQAGSRSHTELQWNAEHQLVTSTTERTGFALQHCRYHYDALGRRVAKTDAFGTTWFVWDGLRMAQERRGSRCVTTLYEDAASYVPLARVEHAAHETTIAAHQVLYFHTDVNGAPEELTSAQGHVIWRARYKTWGNTLREEWDEEYEHPNDQPHEHRTQPLRFQGQYRDGETGLHYNTFRYYDPDIGRFISQDPIGLVGGINLYQYAPNPTAWVDPWGWAALGQLGTYSGLNGGTNVGDGLQAHELIRHEYLQRQGLAGANRLGDNPSIALDLNHHTRGPALDSRGIGGAHYHEAQIRSSRYGLGRNDFHSNQKIELDITQGGIRKSGISASQAKRLRKQANAFIKELQKKKSGASGGCI